jgi:hypothetical protein
MILETPKDSPDADRKNLMRIRKIVSIQRFEGER